MSRPWRMRGPRRAAGTSREANFNTTPATVCRRGNRGYKDTLGEPTWPLPVAERLGRNGLQPLNRICSPE